MIRPLGKVEGVRQIWALLHLSVTAAIGVRSTTARGMRHTSGANILQRARCTTPVAPNDQQLSGSEALLKKQRVINANDAFSLPVSSAFGFWWLRLRYR